MEHTYKKIEVVGTSAISVEAAVNNAIAASSKSLRHLRWFEVQEIRGAITQSQVKEWQVNVKLAFTIEDNDPAVLSKSELVSDSAAGSPPLKPGLGDGEKAV
ncbi:MAG: dodecin family protein [Verrucomicrobiae bacterium]|nr:dodecin family protein [Verrucomicrobiae bacterium]